MKNLVAEKSYKFALDIINLHIELTDSKKFDFAILRQLLKSGTSIGADISEATGSFSKKEFIVKIQIAYKEAKETLYWINLLKDSNIIHMDKAKDLIEKCEEILRITTKIIKTSKQNL